MEAVTGASSTPSVWDCVVVVAQILGAVATILLACITLWYARNTKIMAKAAAEQVALAHKSAQGDMLLRLNELYADQRTTDAIRFMYDFKVDKDKKQPPTTGQSRYSPGQAY